MHKQVYCVNYKQLDSYEVPERGNKKAKKRTSNMKLYLPDKNCLRAHNGLVGSREHYCIFWI